MPSQHHFAKINILFSFIFPYLLVDSVTISTDSQRAEDSEIMAMATHCSSSSLMFASTSPKSFSSSPKKTPFLGFSMAALSKPSFQLSPLAKTNRTAQIRCQDKAAAYIPLDQRWMFEESEIDGPVN